MFFLKKPDKKGFFLGYNRRKGVLNVSYFVIPDIHGCNSPLQSMLHLWDKKKEHLIQLGDMIDRGPNSLEVVQTFMRLKEEGVATVLKGNHEDLFLTFLDYPEEEGQFYYNQGGRQTIASFMGEDVIYRRTSTYIASYIKEHFADEITFIRNLPLYVEKEKWVFVHAGVNLVLADWRNSNENDFNTIRNSFIFEKNEHAQTFVFGHTPTRLLHQDERDDIWISPCGSKIGLDGGLVFQGQLNAMRIQGETYQTIIGN